MIVLLYKFGFLAFVDTEMAQEMKAFTRQAIVMNSARQVLAQTNLQHQAILVLIEQNLSVAS